MQAAVVMALLVSATPARNDEEPVGIGLSGLSHLENPPTTPWSLPDQTTRAVRDPERLVFLVTLTLEKVL